VTTVLPGVDLARFTPGGRRSARRRFGLRPDAVVLLFVGRIQPLKAPDVLVRAAAAMVAADPALRERLAVVVCGGPSGSGLDEPESLHRLAASLGVADLVRFVKPLPPDDLAQLYRAADVTVVPSYNESFGLVAVESQACGTPVVAAAVGGLTTAVADGVSGVLIDGHSPYDYAAVLSRLVTEPARRDALARGAIAHASGFSWQRTADGLLAGYRDALRRHRDDLASVADLAGTAAL
ncbi:MAG TPA: glycosyltransferase, partial [Cryptosporangiaceae bacterium]|nr:glycosyltransferase [Cryptosporangiaceae bacterium]